MALKDKLGAIAKTAADKTGDMMETTKLNIKINEEKSKINAYMEEAGRILYEKFQNDEEIDEPQLLPVEVKDLFFKIKSCEGIIAEYQQQIKAVKDK